jgi:hypothetical protein
MAWVKKPTDIAQKKVRVLTDTSWSHVAAPGRFPGLEFLQLLGSAVCQGDVPWRDAGLLEYSGWK